MTGHIDHQKCVHERLGRTETHIQKHADQSGHDQFGRAELSCTVAQERHNLLTPQYLKKVVCV